MKKFRVVIIDAEGKQIKTVIDAASEHDLFSRIKEQNAHLLSFEEIVPERASVSKLKTKDLIIFTRQLSIMLQSGITVIKAMSIIEEKADSKKIKKVYADIYEHMQKGNSLSSSMRVQRCFPDMLVSMVEAGEASGALEDNLAKMADHFENENKLNNKVKGAMTYPIVLGIVAIAVVLFLITSVLPTFVDMYEGQPLPWPTQFLMNLSAFISNNFVILIVIVAFIVTSIPLIVNIPAVRYKIDTWKLTMPIFGKLNRTIYSARCARTFASLYSSGLDMIELLRMCAKVLNNVVITESFNTVIQKVSRGELVSVSIEQTKLFDPMFTSMIFIGEESGSIDSILVKAADYFDEESETATQRMVSLIEPIMMVIMAIMIGFIVVSMLLPMFGMMELIG